MKILLKNLQLHWKITILSFGIVLFSLLIGGIIIIGKMSMEIESELGQRLLVTARTVAEIPAIAENIVKPDGWKSIQSTTKRIQIVNDVSYIVVLSMNRIRLSDVMEERIGTAFTGKEAGPAFAEHTFVHKVKGELGVALRAYVPVMNAEHRQIGVVMTGHMLPTLYEMLANQKESITITLFLSLLFGVIGSWQLARHMKKQLLNLEPQEIARLLIERTATFQAMHEGVIAIDNALTITIFNEHAKRIFRVSGDVIGKKINDVIPDSRLPEILRLDQPIYNQELQMQHAVIWSNRVPIKVNNKTVGALAIFQDRTEFAKIAEELTGVKAFVEALRVQNHEHRNKMHTIAGLLQLNQAEKALQYVFDVSEKHEELSSFLTENIYDDNLSGLLLSKVGRGKELGIQVEIDRKSRFYAFPNRMDHHDFVLIIGNLVENAFDALTMSKREDKHLFISIHQDEESLSLMVEDNGTGMDASTEARVFERGFTTKYEHNQGLGLYLVKTLVTKGRGEISVDSEPGYGTTFFIQLPMKGEK
ncbi:sensor histidine kinase [Brevibacillus sp. 7WMA2]|uniref:ATP-binding protein n=1 Tax=Brevibacillus TaxID=55080 RepID=UPI00024038D7|nr:MULTISPECIES: sensor histidine kinase [Brevibacillus]MBA4533149.1 sensor histidine kinase [Brevibacillus halotolerans]AUM64923.1 sensor histidine kinase [Brevibacillus laterosporus]MCR8997379.1 sensor histidine kinase [Brevibacillus laterosporus]MDF9414122.1 sensor histidine kinase [Brevibacillus laterosporus]PCN43472.1 histidine kinase [Brevibacillus laterosporus]